MSERSEPPEGRRRSLSVRVRILTAVLLTTALGMMVAGGISYAIARGQAQADVYRSLDQEVEEFRTNTHKVTADPRTGQPIKDLNDVLSYAIRTTYPNDDEAVLALIDGTVTWVPSSDNPQFQESVQRDRQFVAQAASVRPGDSPGVYRASTAAHRDLAYISVPVQVSGSRQLGHYITAVDMRQTFAAVNRNYLAFAGVSLVSLLLIGAVGYLVAGQLLAPLRSLRSTARRITETDLGDRIPDDQLSSRDEVAELGRTMNAMLDRLAYAFDSQRSFLDDVGHELRTPVTIVRGHLELMDADDPADVRETRALSLDELDRMQRLVDDLLLLAKSRRPDFVRPGQVALADLLVSVLDKVTPLNDRDWGIDASSDAVVTLDQQRITQALLQLVSNALRFTEAGSVIALGARIEADQLRLWVRDEGTGIAPEEQKLIFERHQRSTAGEKHPHGVGLGLAIVSAIAEAHNGRVELQSRPGVGSTFSLIIPQRPSRMTDDQPDREDRPWPRS
ncbi:sensor histidine kinase [Microlunatus soli]|uniref:sensor histidine kinase n=1 Tax=Microlunatus soli TaxID=630515 RepID=UPI0012FA736A|nr:HAMP domain-containing sensor histidine kinase [Microlunatus soli]